MKTTTTETDSRPLAERITQGTAFKEFTRGKITLSHPNIYAGTASNQANAEFIAEAFNVTHETGRTPRQLAEDVAELRTALVNAEKMLSGVWQVVELFGEWETGMSEIIDATRAILTKTEPTN